MRAMKYMWVVCITVFSLNSNALTAYEMCKGICGKLMSFSASGGQVVTVCLAPSGENGSMEKVSIGSVDDPNGYNGFVSLEILYHEWVRLGRDDKCDKTKIQAE